MKIYNGPLDMSNFKPNKNGHIEVYCSECEEKALVVELKKASYYDDENPVYCLGCLKKAVELLEREAQAK